MMYLSHLLIDVGSDPDQPRPGRLWLRNMYHVHQRLCMAFPSTERHKTETDPDFLMPYAPEDFPETRHLADQKAETVGRETLSHVHVPRSPDSGFLFRVDRLAGESVGILVLSSVEPNWDYAFGLKPGLLDARTDRPVGNAACLLAAPPSEPRRMQVSIAEGSRFQFMLTANPVRKIATIPKKRREQANQPGRHGRRVPVPAASFGEWLVAQGEMHGFRLVEPLERTLHIQAGYVYVNKTRDSGRGQRLRSVRYDGLLEVVSIDRFHNALHSGIGPAKAFGFGLLSIAPVG